MLSGSDRRGDAARTRVASTGAPPPSAHVRVAVTWAAIFPLVALSMALSESLISGWHPILRALVLTIVVVPLAGYLVVPRLLRLHTFLVTRISQGRDRRRAPRASR